MSVIKALWSPDWIINMKLNILLTNNNLINDLTTMGPNNFFLALPNINNSKILSFTHTGSILSDYLLFWSWILMDFSERSLGSSFKIEWNSDPFCRAKESIQIQDHLTKFVFLTRPVCIVFCLYQHSIVGLESLNLQTMNFLWHSLQIFWSTCSWLGLGWLVQTTHRARKKLSTIETWIA